MQRRELLIASMALAAAPHAAIGADEIAPVPRPDVKVGDRWEYQYTYLSGNLPKTITYESRVTFVGADDIATVEVTGGSRERDVHWTAEWAAVASAVGRIYEPPQRLLQFPLRAGSTYTYSYGIAAAKGSSMRTASQGVGSVLGWERVDTPAGEFRTLRVTLEGTLRRLDIRQTGTQRWDFWYVPEVKRWVKYYYEYQINNQPMPYEKVWQELLSFSVQ